MTGDLLGRLGLRVRGRVPGLRTAKTTLAAVLAYVVALQLPGEARPVLAPLTALLVVQLTLYETVKGGLQRVLSVVAGVIVAVLFAEQPGLTWWSLGLVVALSLGIGKVLRLGPQLMEVPISAMLILAVGGGEEAAVIRVFETLVGAGVGVLVNLLIAPPLYLQPAGDAVGDLAADVSRLLTDMGRQVRRGWGTEDARRWLNAARELGRPIQRAERTLGRAEESLRLNPRRHRVGHAPMPLRAAFGALEHSAIQVRGLCRTLADRAERTTDVGAAGANVRRPLADLLGALGAACAAFGELVAPDVAGPPREPQPLRAALDRAGEHRDALAGAMIVDGASEPELWRLHGGLLADVDRMLRELDPEGAGPAGSARRPPPGPRAAYRRSP